MSQIQINNTINSVNVESTFNTVDVNSDISNILVIPQQVTNVVEIVTPGPQGPPGPVSTGSLINTGSFVTTSSFDAFTSSYTTGSFSGAFAGDGSGLTNLPSQSFDTGSLVTTSSFDAFTSSYTTGSFTGSFAGDGSGLTNIPSTAVNLGQFALLASGSSSDVDGGIIIQNNIDGSGHAFGYGTPENRWVLQSSLNFLSTSFGTTDGYINTTQYGLLNDLPATPSYGGSTYGYGNTYVSTDTNEIFIWS